MPSDGEVVLGTRVAVAGRVQGVRREPGKDVPASLRVLLVIGRTMVGEADLEVVDGRFTGWVDTAEQPRGRAIELRVSDSRHPDQVLARRTFILGPAR